VSEVKAACALSEALSGHRKGTAEEDALVACRHRAAGTLELDDGAL
jgi:hypothetical protein